MNKLQHKTPITDEFEEREILQRNQGLKHINMKLEAQLRHKSIFSLYQPAAGRETNSQIESQTRWQVGNRPSFIFICGFLCIEHFKEQLEQRTDRISTLLKQNFTCKREQATSGLRSAR